MAWQDGKRWAYSITYDEGVQKLLERVAPLHRQYGIPGHVALVASQIGVLRDVPGSSFDGWMILSQAEIDGLCAEGWGVSCHSMTHAATTPENADTEVVQARTTLEQALGRPVTLYCVPGNNDSYPAALAVAAAGGYRAIMTITDEVNAPDADLMRLGRVPIHTRYPGPFYSVFDPYKRLHQARDLGGWVIDYCHCPTPGQPVHEAKDCTLEELEQRFDTVRQVGGDEVWLAEPNEVVEFLMGRSR
jgi:peptidoglycan/xylan/chitin deacetylase (PgdA/CDA1 family)